MKLFGFVLFKNNHKFTLMHGSNNISQVQNKNNHKSKLSANIFLGNINHFI